MSLSRAADLVERNQMSASDWLQTVDNFDEIRSDLSPRLAAVTECVRGLTVSTEDFAALLRMHAEVE